MQRHIWHTVLPDLPIENANRNIHETYIRGLTEILGVNVFMSSIEFLICFFIDVIYFLLFLSRFINSGSGYSRRYNKHDIFVEFRSRIYCLAFFDSTLCDRRLKTK